MPIDVPALFLIGETNQILDARFGNEQDLHHRAQEFRKRQTVSLQARW